jgi:MFS family permease
LIVGGRVRFTAAGRALKHRNFRLFFFGQLISVTGTWMQTLAQGWLLGTLLNWDSTAVAYLGFLGAIQFLPVLILGLFGGIIADIWPKRYTVIATQMSAAILALLLGSLDFFHVVAIWHLFVLALLLGVVNAVDMPARQSFVVEMVGNDDVANAVALNSAVFNSARIVGPSLAGLMIVALGTAPCFIINGLSYGAVVVGLLAMRDSELLPARRLPMPKSVGGVGRSLGEGLGYVGRTPVVLLAILVIGLVSTFGLNFNVVLPVLSENVLNAGAGGYSLLSAVMGAGALTAALTVATLTRPRLRVLVGGGLVLGASEVVLANTTSLSVAMVAMYFCGAGAIATAATCNSLIQITVPGPLRGRVMSVYTTVFAGSTPIGNGLTGGFGGIWGTPAAVLMNGLATAGAAAVAAVAVVRGSIRIGGVGGGVSGPGGSERRPEPEPQLEPGPAPVTLSPGGPAAGRPAVPSAD